MAGGGGTGTPPHCVLGSCLPVRRFELPWRMPRDERTVAHETVDPVADDVAQPAVSPTFHDGPCRPSKGDIARRHVVRDGGRRSPIMLRFTGNGGARSPLRVQPDRMEPAGLLALEVPEAGTFAVSLIWHQVGGQDGGDSDMHAIPVVRDTRETWTSSPSGLRTPYRTLSSCRDCGSVTSYTRASGGTGTRSRLPGKGTGPMLATLRSAETS